MAFPKEVSNTPTEIGRIVVTFETLSAASTAVDSATVGYVLLAANGSPKGDRTLNLLTEITTAQKTTLFNLMSAIRTKVKTEAIP